MRNINSKKNKEWRSCVIEKSNGRCVVCGKTGHHCHHIVPFSVSKSKRYDINNGVLLCKTCHALVHGNKIDHNALMRRSNKASEVVTKSIISAIQKHPVMVTDDRMKYVPNYPAWGNHLCAVKDTKINNHSFGHCNAIY